MHRLFVALRPPAEICGKLLDLMGGMPGARWQSEEQLHLTLRFIGEVDRRTAEDVALALSRVRAPEMEIALSGAGMFDKRGVVHTLWAGVSPAEPLASLHRKTDHALVSLGLPSEARAYQPHITLARGRMGPEAHAFVAAQGGLSSPPFLCTAFGLYESTLGRDGPSYTLIERYPLAKPRASASHAATVR
jgi:RNA 2',3'-cyclic 3'-phosphodiesterase